MANPLYSSTALPVNPLLETWKIVKPYQDPMVTETDGANKRMRTRPGDETAEISFDLLFTQSQFATFKGFVLTTLHRGTLRFDMNIWTGNAMVLKTVQFAKPFQNSTVAPYEQVAFDLYVYGGL